MLVTRAPAASAETAERLAAMGFSAVIAPLLTVEALPARLPVGAQAIVCTSANAVDGLTAVGRATRLFAVGAATARRAAQAGFADVVSADGDAVALAALIARSCAPAGGKLLLACGRRQGRALSADLRALGFRVVRRAVYEVRPARALPDEARRALRTGRVQAALFFSAETAATFATLVTRAGLSDTLVTVDALTIGRPAAMALERLPWRQIAVADHPDQDALLALLR